MAHPYHAHRDMQRGHRRVGEVLKDHPDGATKHANGGAFSRVTSKSAAADHDRNVSGSKSPKRYARGGKVKGAQTNIAIIVPGAKGEGADAGPKLPLPGLPAGGPPPMPPMPPGGPMAGPPGLPPGMPMRAKGGRVNKADGGDVSWEAGSGRGMLEDRKSAGMRRQTGNYSGPSTRASGGKVIDGEDTKSNQKKWADRAAKNSYFRGGAASGVGREEKAEHMKRKGK